MPDWKRVKITFSTEKLEKFIEPVKRTVQETTGKDYHSVYGVTNTEGITVTGKKTSKDISNYITIDEGCFAYNPYRINVGSIGFNNKNLKGCVSPAYVVFKTRTGFSPEFLFLYLKSDFGNHLINWYGNRGGVRNALRYDDLCKIDVPKINYKEQIVLLNKMQKINTIIYEFNSGLDNQLSLLKKLRQQILQEAIEGKLTAEWRKKNPKLISGDNHASKLLEKIKAEKERLIKQRIVGKDKLFSPIADEDKQFVLPEGWAWCRFGEYAFFKRGRFSIRPRNDKSCYGGKYPFIQIGSLNNEGSVIIDFKQTLNEKGFSVSKQFKKGTIAIAIVGGTIGNLGVLGIDMCFPDSMVGIRPTINSNQKYVLLLLRSKQPEIRKAAYQMAGQPNIKLPTLTGLVVALPPLVEQQAIVERVNKIMAIIDELEKQVAERKDKSERLMQSVLREAFAQ